MARKTIKQLEEQINKHKQFVQEVEYMLEYAAVEGILEDLCAKGKSLVDRVSKLGGFNNPLYKEYKVDFVAIQATSGGKVDFVATEATSGDEVDFVAFVRATSGDEAADIVLDTLSKGEGGDAFEIVNSEEV